MIVLYILVLMLAIAGYRTSKKLQVLTVLADEKATHIHKHMQALIVSSLEELRAIIKERLDQFLTMIEALEQSQLQQTLRIDGLDPEKTKAWLKGIREHVANGIGNARQSAESATQNMLNKQQAVVDNSIKRIDGLALDATQKGERIIELGDNLKVFNESLGELEGNLNLFDLTVFQNDVVQLNTQTTVNKREIAEHYDRIKKLEKTS